MKTYDMTEYLAAEEEGQPLFRVTLGFANNLDGKTAQTISAVFEGLCVSVLLHNKEATDGDNWDVTLITYGAPDQSVFESCFATLSLQPRLHIEKLPETDWLQHVHDKFPPVTIGKFFVYGSHYTGDIPKDHIPLCIDAATAFGSGEHETTSGCLQALEKLSLEGRQFKNALDMGCGSGILAIAMTKIWPDIQMRAVDIDPESVKVTNRHAEMNAATHIQTAAGDGYHTPLAKAGAPYDLIVCNILAGPLIEMAAAAAQSLLPGGYVLLSGLLARQEQDVIKAHEKEGLSFLSSLVLGDWRVLIFAKVT